VSNTKKALRKCVHKFGKLKLRCGIEDGDFNPADYKSEGQSHGVQHNSDTTSPENTDLATSKISALLIDEMPTQPLVDPSLEIRLFHHYIHFSVDRRLVTLTRTRSLPLINCERPNPDSSFEPELYNPHEIMAFAQHSENPRILSEVGIGNWPRTNQALSWSFSFSDFGCLLGKGEERRMEGKGVERRLIEGWDMGGMFGV